MSKQILIKVDYFRDGGALSHSYEERWGKSSLFCPNCGGLSLWVEDGPGDYYLGRSHLCVNCSHGFCLPSEPSDDSNDSQSKQRLAALKANE